LVALRTFLNNVLTDQLTIDRNGLVNIPSGVLLVGAASPSAGLSVDPTNTTLLSTGMAYSVTRTTGNMFLASMYSATPTASAPIILRKVHNGTIGATTAVTTSDLLGNLTFQGMDTAAAFQPASAIYGMVDPSGTVGSGRVDGYLSFRTALAGTLTEQMIIDRNGLVIMVGALTIGGAFTGQGATFQSTVTVTGAPVVVTGDSTNAAFQGTRYATGAAAGALVDMRRSHNATLGIDTVVSLGDSLGIVRGFGFDGTAYKNAAQIALKADPNGTITNNVRVDGLLSFQTALNNVMSEAFSIDRNNLFTFAEGSVFTFGGTTGTKFGAATTDKMALWNKTPIIQPASANQAALAAQSSATLTDNTTGTANATLQALTSGSVYATDVAAIRNNFADLAAMANNLTADVTALYTLVAAIRTAMVNYGSMKGSA
jgi:hypothetical protein